MYLGGGEVPFINPPNLNLQVCLEMIALFCPWGYYACLHVYTAFGVIILDCMFTQPLCDNWNFRVMALWFGQARSYITQHNSSIVNIPLWC